MRYVATLGGEWVALVGFGSAVLSCAARDRFLGWSRDQQYARLAHVVNNQRLCVLPAGRRPNLASAVLARVLRRLAADYLAAYGRRVLAVETFTDPAVHTGACYAAANFYPAGESLGFSRSAGRYHHHGNRKRVWMYLLHPAATRVLSATYPHPLLTANTGRIDLNALPLSGRGGLLAVLAGVTDPRKKRGVRHQVAAVLTMTAAAALAGCRSFRSVADFVADLPQDALARLGARRHPVSGQYVAPSEPTIRRTVTSVDADEADALIGTWLMAQVRAGRVAGSEAPTWTAIALDGKTLKGAWAELNTGDGKARLFSALVHAEGVVVGQRAVPDGAGETTQVVPLLDAVAGDGHDGLSGTVVTADALHTHRTNIEEILARDGEYALTVKGNQPTLHQQVKDLFAAGDGHGDFPPAPRRV